MIKKYPTNKYLLFVLVLFQLLLLLQGCSVNQKEFRAYSGSYPDWRMVENCGYEGCYPMVDYLTGPDMTIRLELDNDRQTGMFFVVRTGFETVKNEIEYNPSNITVKLGTGEVLKPKVFTGANTVWDLNHLRNSPSLQGRVPVNKNAGYLLFFDHPQLSDSDVAEMNFNEAFTAHGKCIDLPVSYFRKKLTGKKGGS